METKLFSGKSVHVSEVEKGFIQIQFDLLGESTNRFNQLTLGELREALETVKKQNPKGVLLTTNKDAFFVGADVTEFLTLFKHPVAELEAGLWKTQVLFSEIEDLPCPTITVLKGNALGGGCEVSLTTAFRIGAPNTKIGLPETKLGIFPGWGGTVRLSRLAGADNAIEWIASGKAYSAKDALKFGVLDAIVEEKDLMNAAIQMLKDASEGKLDWKKRQDRKRKPLILAGVETAMTFEGGKGFVAGQAGPNYPAPVAAIEVMQQGAKLGRDEALKIETQGFIKMTQTPQAHALISLFLGDQALKKKSKAAAKAGKTITKSAVLGAGIMGGGIAYQSASSGVPIVMKDIRDEALALGMGEATKLLSKKVERSQMNAVEMAQTLTRIHPTLELRDLASAELIVEAVVENEKIKKSVLAETESLIKSDAVLCSNTSTISITRLAEGLKRPENFCGMHFFNPVHRMPLVEIIRGAKTSETTIATAVAYAAAIGKTPVVVNDCPGFLVNRVLFPYFGGFMQLVRDGVEFTRIDKVMEKFGWPMGPAYLLDVVGIDTAHHALAVMSEGFPERMKYDFKTAIDVQYEAKRFGQKNGKGFFSYKTDPKGKPVKEVDGEIAALLKPIVTNKVEVTDEEIIERMMLPMIFECSRCLEEKIVESPLEVDMSLIYGLGYPPFRAGALKTADAWGAEKLVALANKYQSLGKMYEATNQIKKLASDKKGFYV